MTPDPVGIWAERETLRTVLLVWGVCRCDVDDAVQVCVVRAWEAGRAGRYRPNPSRDPGGALRTWLVGIAIRSATHFRGRACRRREVSAEGLVLPEAEQVPHAEIRMQVSEMLSALSRLRPERREVLVLAGLGWHMSEMASHLSLPEGTVATRLRLARKDLGRALRRRRC